MKRSTLRNIWIAAAICAASALWAWSQGMGTHPLEFPFRWDRPERPGWLTPSSGEQRRELKRDYAFTLGLVQRVHDEALDLRTAANILHYDAGQALERLRRLENALGVAKAQKELFLKGLNVSQRVLVQEPALEVEKSQTSIGVRIESLKQELDKPQIDQDLIADQIKGVIQETEGWEKQIRSLGTLLGL